VRGLGAGRGYEGGATSSFDNFGVDCELAFEFDHPESRSGVADDRFMDAASILGARSRDRRS
jgi:hypothetical protein